MSFIEVKLPDWDSSKVTINKYKKDDEGPTVLYDGKLVILTVIGDSSEKYILHSFDGLKKSTKYDQVNNKFTDEWDGSWAISFKVADSIKNASPMQKKLMDVIDDIIEKTSKVFRKELSSMPIRYKYESTISDEGVALLGDKLQDEPVYINAKASYTCDKDAEMITINNRQVPDFKDRKVKPPFYDLSRARAEMKIENPDKECNTGMKVVPKIMLSIYSSKLGLFLTRKLMGCYYEPVDMGGSGQDDNLIDMLRPIMDDLEFE